MIRHQKLRQTAVALSPLSVLDNIYFKTLWDIIHISLSHPFKFTIQCFLICTNLPSVSVDLFFNGSEAARPCIPHCYISAWPEISAYTQFAPKFLHIISIYECQPWRVHLFHPYCCLWEQQKPKRFQPAIKNSISVDWSKLLI